jgi:hypothetical protein
MKTLSSLFALALAATFNSGCGVGAPEDGAPGADNTELAQSQDGLVFCYAGTCDFQDPGTFGCEADATTVASSDVRTWSGGVIGKIAIRYSAACRATWARTSVTVLSPFFLRAEIYRGGTTAQAASGSPVTALRSPMLGVINSGTMFRAVGYAGTYYGDMSYASGSVSAPIY